MFVIRERLYAHPVVLLCFKGLEIQTQCPLRHTSNAFCVRRTVADADPCSPFTPYIEALDDSTVLYALLCVLLL